MILTCHFLATILVWWSFLVSSWVEIELPGDPNILVSAPFKDCSSQMCWVPKHKPSESWFNLQPRVPASCAPRRPCHSFPLVPTHTCCAACTPGHSENQGVDPKKGRTYQTLSCHPSLILAYFILGGGLMINALLLSLCFNFLLLVFPQLFPETQKQYVSCAFIFIITGKERQEWTRKVLALG